MENGQKLCSYQQAKDFLMTAADMHKPGKKVPHGAQQSVWMCLMAPPNDHHNEVYQNIILGDDHLAKSADELRALGVTHVVNCACGKRFNMVDTSAEDFASSGIQFHGIAATDIMTFKMAPHFEAASKFMKDALDGGGKLYVHCVSGVSRSATIVPALCSSDASNDGTGTSTQTSQDHA